MRSIYFTLFASLLFSLNNKLAAQYILYGKWDVFCPIEKPFRYCDICGMEKDEKMGNVVYGFEMDFNQDSLYIKNLGLRSDKVKYNWDKKTNTLYFNYQKKDYSFELLGCGNANHLILKDKRCLLLALERKEEKK
jgi:hypothetical protein